MLSYPKGKEPDLKSGDGESHCGFESYTQRHAVVAQWESNRLVSDRLVVRLHLAAPWNYARLQIPRVK